MHTFFLAPSIPRSEHVSVQSAVDYTLKEFASTTLMQASNKGFALCTRKQLCLQLYAVIKVNDEQWNDLQYMAQAY